MIGDQEIGQMLSGAPADPDGKWPCAAVRSVIEEVHNDEIERGLSIGVYNSRGVFSRSIGEGGVLETAPQQVVGICLSNPTSQVFPATKSHFLRDCRDLVGGDARVVSEPKTTSEAGERIRIVVPFLVALNEIPNEAQEIVVQDPSAIELPQGFGVAVLATDMLTP